MLYSKLQVKFFPKSFRKLLYFSLISVTIIAIYAYLATSAIKYPDVELLRQTAATKTELDTIISDVQLIKCFMHSCKAPEGYTKLEPPINYYEASVDSSATGKLTTPLYFISVKKQRIDASTKILTDLTFEKPNGDDFEVIEIDRYKLFKKYCITNISSPIPKDLPLVHSIDVLFGSNDLIDSRLHHYSVHSNKFSEDIHPIISLFKLSTNKHDSWLSEVMSFSTLQQNQVVTAPDSKFKILQLSDLHFGQNLGRTCDSQSQMCSSDLKTVKFIEESIEKEKPNLVVITGDLIDLHRSVDYKSIILKSLQPILKRNVNFVFTFGDEIEPNRFTNIREIKKTIVAFLQTLPNCYNTLDQVDNELHGLTNYNLKVIKDDKELALITILDSEDHFIDETQSNYLYRVHSASSQDSLFRLLFFHYPIGQFRPKGKFKIIGGYNEKHPLYTKTHDKVHGDILNCGYQVVSVGHEHENDACILSEVEKDGVRQSIWLCYSSITGDSGVTKLDENYDRKVRLFELDFAGRKLLSWKRSEKNKKGFDYQMIYEYK
ncbi:Metallo-dependent phosphatase-like protein [Scheffersomyces xylosifermentans]|uniref:Metallo-dependent phosphatase-like protein n=1 Tax=Scheffersomyces xylosifermentans TaxID=1304137 RepID=UPI00315CA82A